MVNGWSIPPLLMASINAYLAVHFLVIHIRTRMAREQLSFAFLALVACLYEVSCAFVYSAPSPEDARPWQVLQTGVVSIAAIGLLVFVGHYTHRRPGRFMVGLCTGYGLILAAALIGGFNLVFTRVPLVKHLSLPLGVAVTYNEVEAGPLVALHDLVSLSVFVFVFTAAAAQYRTEERRRARLLVAATGVLFIAALNDGALGLGLVHSVYMIEYAFMGMVILMADSLSNELVRVARMDEALWQSERNYREVFNATGDAIFVHDAATGAILDVNETMLQLFGYTFDEALRLTFAELSAQNLQFSPQEVETRIRRATEEGPQLFEWRSRRKNGKEFPTEVALKSCSISGQGRVLTVVRDITRRKLAESSQAAIYEISQAAQNATNLEELFVAIHEIVGRLMNARNLYVALYDPVADLISYPYFVDERKEQPRPHPPGWGLTAYVLRTGRPLLATPEVFEDLLRRGEVEKLEAPFIDWLGIPLVVRDRVIGVLAVETYVGSVRLSGADEEVLTYVSSQVAQAIERRQAEDALHESEERFRRLSEATFEGIGITDQGRIVDANTRLAEMFGCSLSELLGRNVMDFVAPESAEQVESFMREGKDEMYQHLAIRKDGSVFPVETQGRPMPGGGTMRVAAVRDIGDRKRLEEQLLQAQKMDAIGRVSAGIVHEVKNPLFAISSGIQLLMDELALTPEQRETLEIIYKDVRRMDRLVQQLHVFSSQRQLRKTEQAAVDLVRDAVTLHRGMLAARSVRIMESFGPDLPAIRVDRDRIHQVVINLLQNAIAASPQGGEIEVGVRRVTGRRAIAIHVRDRGPGVPEELRARIFEPFFTTKQGSAGLGLSICASIAQEHGGSLEVCDHPDGGAVFTLELPLEAQQ